MNNKVVYLHRRKDTGEVFYVGYGEPERAHDKNEGRRSSEWLEITQKYGYTIEIVKKDLTRIEGLALETQLIAHYGRKDLGLGNLVNLTNGGQGFIHTPQSKQKLSEKHKGKKLSEKQINEMRISRLGKKHSEETKQKMSSSRKGKKHSEEWVSKMKRANRSLSKLNVEDVIFIKNNYVWGCKTYGQTALANKFGVSKQTIFRIVHNINWSDVIPENVDKNI